MPFNKEQFFEVFQKYNLAVEPAQLFLFFLAALASFLAFRKNPYSDRIISAILAFLWLWMGIAYHFLFFAAINKAAYFFGSLFIAQGVLFLLLGLIKKSISFQTPGLAGGILIVYALVLYPLVGYFLGHHYPQSPTFGLPCPTVIFTLGMAFGMKKPVPRSWLVIPILWVFVGGSAAILFGVWEDLGLPAAGLLAFWFNFRKK